MRKTFKIANIFIIIISTYSSAVKTSKISMYRCLSTTLYPSGPCARIVGAAQLDSRLEHAESYTTESRRDPRVRSDSDKPFEKLTVREIAQDAEGISHLLSTRTHKEDHCK